MKKLLVVAVIASAAGYGVYRWQRSDAPAPIAAKSDAKLVKDRLWVDHIPRSDRDTIQVFAALSEDPVGVFQSASMWKGQYELFRYESNGEEFRIVYPQDGKRESVKLVATECNQNGMDYCLEVKGSSRGTKRYYSMEGWEIGSLANLQQLRALVH